MNSQQLARTSGMALMWSRSFWHRGMQEASHMVFYSLEDGARAMDLHFKDAPMEKTLGLSTDHVIHVLIYI